MYNLSDDQLEFQIVDRASFKRFLGLKKSDKVPDSKTFWFFREQLIEKDVITGLFKCFNETLDAAGVFANEGKMVDASAYGADTVLLVPGRVNDIVSYDECWNRSVEELKKVIPLAEKLKVKIALENVPNYFLLSPIEAALFVDQFQSPYLGFYFDCGNILVYGWPEQWIKILGKRIAKVHIKEFSRKIADKEGKSAGFGVKLLEGDVNWSAVMKALDDIGYNGWTTIEQPGGNNPEGLKDLCDRLKNIQAS